MANEVKIAIRAFTYHKEIEDPSTGNKTIVSDLATKGQVLEVSDADFERGSRLGAFADDTEPTGPAGGFSVVDASDDEVDEYLLENEPNADATVALAGDDPESAQRLIDAEERTREEPRKGVLEKLEKIAAGE